MTMDNTSIIALRAVQKAYTPGTHAVDGVSFTVERGALVALLGPSGCGKTTTLRLIAGLERPDVGEIALAGRRVAGSGVWVPPESRQVGMVFQDYALFPHLNVERNIAFPLHRRPANAQRQRVAAMLDLVGMAGMERRYPHQLSGGQQQRVALARALAPDPAVLLLDEPFSNLDAALRAQMRVEVQQIVRAAGTTTVFVTHDQEEALSLADLVAVMFHGQVVQIGPPQAIYARPATQEVADFMGEANWLEGEARGGEAHCRLGRVALAQPLHGRVTLLARPEAIRLTPDPAGAARVEWVRYFGHDQSVALSLPDGAQLNARTEPRADIYPGAWVHLSLAGPVMAYPATQPCANNGGARDYERLDAPAMVSGEAGMPGATV